MNSKQRQQYLQTKRIVKLIDKITVEAYIDGVLKTPEQYRDDMIENVSEMVKSFKETFGK